MAKITGLTVNGKKLTVDVDSQTSLLTVLRNDLDLTGTKYGCGEAQCGACTVLVDGQQTRSCVTPVGKVANKQITTIEGLEKDGQLHPVQAAFLKADAMQCGYCTPGMIMASVALLNKHSQPTVDQIVRHMDGNVCRCGVYLRIIKAIQMAASDNRDRKEAE
jgi:aerobic-type carbon monoxide dehydrogenase small subunit (CoxS/CutS family)